MNGLGRWTALAAAVIATAAAAAESAPPPPVVGIVTTGRAAALRPLDPRTLQPLPNAWARPVASPALLARSPGGSGVVVSWKTGTAVFDARTGKRLARFDPEGVDGRLYWLGRESWRRGDLVMVEEPVCFSGGCGVEFRPLGSINAPLDAEVATVSAAVADGLVSVYDATTPTRTIGLFIYPAEVEVPLERMPAAPTVVVGDSRRDRVFVVSSGGVVARVDRIGGKPVVTYHRVDLDGSSFGAAWAGGDRIALWGAGGLGTIDVRTWQTRAIAPGIAHAVATPYGIAGWGQGGGLSVYRPHGALRFHVLGGEQVRSVETLGSYLYVRADHRYTVDLVTGRVLGRARADAQLALPSYASIL